MALGPLGKVIAQGIVLGMTILARALPAAYANALANARKSGVDKAADEAARKGASFLGKARMSKDEALQVLNLNESEATAEAVQKQYERYFEANKVHSNGGSFYLQSKVFRAKELMDEFIKEKNQQRNRQDQQNK